MIKDILQENEQITPNSKQLAVLKENFPSCFKADGSFDLERFKSEIAGQTQVIQEGYELKFLGKSYAKLLASTDTTTVIKPNEAHNALPENENSENIYISGDNLDGLKHLLKSYSGAIKCIYIDPPYNTGSDGFVYQDNFNYSKESLVEKLSVSEEEADRILDLTKRGSASHSAWLMFMYSRLVLARDLLDEKGVIFISIDDNEQSNLKLLCDEVFGEENFLANVIWEKRFTRSNNSKTFATLTEHVLCFRRTELLSEIKEPRDEKADSTYSNPDNDPRGLWTSVSYVNPATKEQRPNLAYELVNPHNGEKITHPTHAWKFEYSKYRKHVKENRLYWGKEGGNTYPRLKRFLSEMEGGMVPVNFWSRTSTGTTDEASKNLDSLMGKKVFDFPKPIGLISKALKIGVGKDDIILDFFSGSGTTAHAVMQLNAEDGGKRKFISVQWPEKLSKENPSQKAAFEFLENLGYPTTLDYIGYERIKRASSKIKSEHPEKELDLGFKHYILDEPNPQTLDKLETFDPNALITDSSILKDFGKPTILTTWLNADGYGLTPKPDVIDLAGYEAYYIQKHLYLIDSGFNLDSMKALLNKYDAEGKFNPENLVLFGYSFPDWSINEMMEKNLKILNDGEKNLKINFSVRY